MKNTTCMRWLLPILVLGLVCSFTLTAAAQNYYPAAIGNVWTLTSTDGTEERTYSLEEPDIEVDAGVVLLKIATAVVGTEAVDIDNYYVTVDAEGIKLHQSATDEGTFGIAKAQFDPPASFFPLPLVLGDAWEIVAETELKLVGATTSTTSAEVVALETITTSAGTFDNCVKIQLKRRVVTRLVTTRSTSYQWLAPDVGPVKYENDQGVVYELMDYTVLPDAPAEPEMPVADEPAVDEPVMPAGHSFALALEPGLNLISVPLMPAEPYTAKSLADMLGATVVIQLDAMTKEFVAYSVAEGDAGFGISGDRGYIVNTPAGGMVTFTGQAWANPPAEEPDVEEPVVPEEPATEEPVVTEESTDDEPAEDEGDAPVVAETPEAPAEGEMPAEGEGDAPVVAEMPETPAEDDMPAEEETPEAPAAGEGDAPVVAETPEAPAEGEGEDEAPAAPALRTYNGTWAFVVTSDLQGIEAGASYVVVAENLRTGIVTTKQVSGDAQRISAAWADMNRKSVVEAGDKLEVALYDARGVIVSGPFQRTVTTTDIRNAYLTLQLRVGDVQPKDTLLAQNFPNPFNPETWIPYQLSKSTEVTLQIYDISGRLVRTLDLGWKPTGSYMTQSSAAYWDGRNSVGERVASGPYFYTLQTRDFAATRRMVILK